MKRLIIAAGICLLAVASAFGAEPKLGVWRIAQDDWRTSDKLGHALFYGWVSREWADITKNKWAGAGISLFIATAVNEGKDALVPWESYGAVGGDGWSWWDIGADAVGIGWSLWFPPEPSRKGIYCARPLKELWPKVGTAFLIGGGWIGACAVYNSAVNGKPFPSGSGKWAKLESDQVSFTHVLSDFNGEISFIGPWWLNAHLRPYMPLGWRVSAIGVSLIGFETLNGYLRQKDVPFWGDKGFREADISVGATSLSLVIVYEVFLFPKSAVCLPHYTVRPTTNGLAVQFTF